MNPASLDRLSSFLREQKLSSVLLSNPANLAWLTGYAPPIETGPNPFEGGPALAWVKEEQVTLVLSDMESAAALACGVETVDYVAYSIEAPVAGYQNQSAALAGALEPYKSLDEVVGIEFNALPASFVQILREALPEAELRPIDGALDGLRAIKSAHEVDLLRRSLALCDLAQSEAEKAIRTGTTEVEVWAAVKGALEVQAGGRLPVLADLVAGMRTADIGGLPGLNLVQAGDPVIVDIVPRLDGYWGDNAGTHFAGEPSPELKKMYDVVLAALRKGIAAVRPGLRACDLDALLRASIRDAGYEPYPHHSGHGIGTSYHEEPRIVPYNQMPLAPGMVIALEPGIYIPGIGGVRLEDVVLMKENGCEVLTKHLGNG